MLQAMNAVGGVFRMLNHLTRRVAEIVELFVNYITMGIPISKLSGQLLCFFLLYSNIIVFEMWVKGGRCVSS